MAFNVARKLRKLEEEEEKYMIILQVREDLINHVLDRCYERYLERQSVKFVVHCAHMALRKILNLQFFMHNPTRPFYEGHPDWYADAAPEPAIPDSWSADTIVAVKKYDEKSVSSPESEDYSSDESSSSESQESTVVEKVAEEITAKSVVTFPSQVSQKAEEDHQSYESVVSSASIFTKTKFMNFNTLPQQLVPNNSKMKDFYLPEVVPHPLVAKGSPRISRMQLSLDKLPPIRAITKFKQNEKDDQKKKKK